MTASSEQLRQMFDAEEWRLISSAPAIAGAYTALSSDRKITDKEWQALHDALDPLKATSDDALFTMSLVETVDTVKQALDSGKLPTLALGEIDMTDLDAVRQAALSYFSRVNTALRDAPPEVQTRFKDSILLVAQKVAESQAEGGFLGIGGRDISAGEIQALKDIAGKLGYDTGAGSDWSQRIIVPTNTYRAQ